jgi:hypothetical protein
MSAKITVALLLMALAVGCEPEPMLNPAVALKPVSAGEAVSAEGPLPAGENGDDGTTVAVTPVIERLRARAEALCARKSKRSSGARSWFACERASTGTQACRTAQVEAGREWLEGLQIETIQEIGAEAALGCFRESTSAGTPTLGLLPTPEAWLTDWVLVTSCARDRMKRVRAKAAP